MLYYMSSTKYLYLFLCLAPLPVLQELAQPMRIAAQKCLIFKLGKSSDTSNTTRVQYSLSICRVIVRQFYTQSPTVVTHYLSNLLLAFQSFLSFSTSSFVLLSYHLNKPLVPNAMSQCLHCQTETMIISIITLTIKFLKTNHVSKEKLHLRS